MFKYPRFVINSRGQVSRAKNCCIVRLQRRHPPASFNIDVGPSFACVGSVRWASASVGHPPAGPALNRRPIQTVRREPDRSAIQFLSATPQSGNRRLPCQRRERPHNNPIGLFPGDRVKPPPAQANDPTGCSVSPSPGIGLHLPTSGRIFYILRPSGSLFRPHSLHCRRMKHKSSADRVAFQPNGQVHG
jgi:hypothetical protein